MRVIYAINKNGVEGPAFVFDQIRQALDEAEVLSKYVYLPIDDPVEFDRAAKKELEECNLLVCPLGMPFLLNKAKRMGIKTLALEFSTHMIHRVRILEPFFRQYNKDVRGQHPNRVLKAYKEADYFLVLSEYCKYTYCSHGIRPEQVFVAHPGVDTKKFSFAEPLVSPFRVLFVGSNSLRKGVPYLLKAWEELVSEGLNGVLIVRTRGVKILLAAPLIPLEGSSVSPKTFVNMQEWISESDLADLYHGCSITILPSLEEGFPATHFESMASGRPVIATNVTGLDEVITNYEEGIVIPLANIKAIKDAILYFYNNPNEIVRMGKNARRLAEQYPWSRFRSRVAEIVKGLPLNS